MVSVGCVLTEWRDAVVVPVSKKGDLKYCDNWQGLLDIVGKLFGRILKNRLEELSEAVLPDSQCGFRSCRCCVDMVFVIRQLIEKTIEHDSSLYILFVDLKKAYDSIPRDCLWRVLEKLGVPPAMLSIIRSLHEGMHMQAVVRVPGQQRPMSGLHVVTHAIQCLLLCCCRALAASVSRSWCVCSVQAWS